MLEKIPSPKNEPAKTGLIRLKSLIFSAVKSALCFVLSLAFFLAPAAAQNQSEKSIKERVQFIRAKMNQKNRDQSDNHPKQVIKEENFQWYPWRNWGNWGNWGNWRRW